MASLQGRQMDSGGLYHWDPEEGKAYTEHHRQPSLSWLMQGGRQALVTHYMVTGPEKKRAAQGVSRQHGGLAKIDGKFQQQLPSSITPYCRTARGSGGSQSGAVRNWTSTDRDRGNILQDQRKSSKKAPEHELKSRMAEVDHQLFSTRTKIIQISSSLM